MKKSLKGDLIPGLIGVFFGVIVIILTLTGNDMAIMIAKKRGSIPGPGFFPTICGVLMVLFGAGLSFRGLRQKVSVDYFKMTDEIRGNAKIAMFVVLGLIVFLIAWKITNLFIPLVFILAVYLNLLFKRSWLFTLIFSIVLTAFIYFLFVRGFSVTFRV